MSPRSAPEPLQFDLSGIRVRLEGLSEPLARRWREEWAAFLAPPAGESFLRFCVTYDDRTSGEGAWSPKEMRSTLDADHAEYTLDEGEVHVDHRGLARVTLRRDLGAREFFTASNLLRASLAWTMPDRGGALLHAAALVLDDRAWLLVGAEGTGKSTWARLGEEAGARVVSDDLIVLDGAGEALELIDAPFHSTHRIDHAPGRWPLAGVLFPCHGNPPRRRPATSLVARARLTANMTFVADAVGRDARLGNVLDRLAGSVPLEDLTFGLDPSFVALLRRSP